MPGFLTRSRVDEDAPLHDEKEMKEETYQGLYSKIARDFVHKEDFYNILEHVLRLLDLGHINIRDDTVARLRSAEYRNLEEDGNAGAQVYKDLGETE